MTNSTRQVSFGSTRSTAGLRSNYGAVSSIAHEFVMHFYTPRLFEGRAERLAYAISRPRFALAFGTRTSDEIPDLSVERIKGPG